MAVVASLVRRDDREAGRKMRAYSRWERFDLEFSTAQRQVRAVPAGEARWSDLERFARDAIGARSVEGGSALRFRFEGDEVVEEPGHATVLEIDGALFASDDYGSMPVSVEGGRMAQQLGLNLDVVATALRQQGWATAGPGVAHVRPGDRVAGLGVTPPFSLLVYGRVNFSVEGNTYSEVGMDLRMFAILPRATGRRSRAGSRERSFARCSTRRCGGIRMQHRQASPPS